MSHANIAYIYIYIHIYIYIYIYIYAAFICFDNLECIHSQKTKPCACRMQRFRPGTRESGSDLEIKTSSPGRRHILMGFGSFGTVSGCVVYVGYSRSSRVQGCRSDLTRQRLEEACKASGAGTAQQIDAKCLRH